MTAPSVLPALSPLACAADLLRRDLALAWRRRADLATTLCFFATVTLFFPFATGADQKLTQALGPGVLWVAALLAQVLAAQRVFADDARDGTLVQWLVSPNPLPLLVASRLLSQWLIGSLPLVLITPLLALPFDLPADAVLILTASLLIGTPALTAIGLVAAALTLELRQGAALVTLLVFPLEVPVLIFGAGAVDAWNGGLPAAPYLLLLAAFSVVTVPGALLVTGPALRIAHA